MIIQAIEERFKDNDDSLSRLTLIIKEIKMGPERIQSMAQVAISRAEGRYGIHFIRSEQKIDVHLDCRYIFAGTTIFGNRKFWYSVRAHSSTLYLGTIKVLHWFACARYPNDCAVMCPSPYVSSQISAPIGLCLVLESWKYHCMRVEMRPTRFFRAYWLFVPFIFQNLLVLFTMRQMYVFLFH